MGLVLLVLLKMCGNEVSKDRDIKNHLLTRISVSFCIYSMRGLEKERDKGQRVIKNTRETIETKGMMVRVKGYGRRNREE